jgi:hypothetical protein
VPPPWSRCIAGFPGHGLGGSTSREVGAALTLARRKRGVGAWGSSSSRRRRDPRSHLSPEPFVGPGQRQAATGGPRALHNRGVAEGRPRHPSTRRVAQRPWMTACTRKRPSQCGHSSASAPNTRNRSSAQGIQAGWWRRRALALAGSSVSRGPGSTLGLGTMSARPRAAGAKTPWE